MATKKKKKKKKSIGLKIIKYLFLIILAAVLIVAGVVLGVATGAKNSAPAITEANVIPTTYPSVIYDRNGKEQIQLSAQGERRTEAEWEEIPKNLKWAFVDLEDVRFYDHNGVDLKGIIRAAYTTLTTDRKEGASTITQQLIKNNVFETKGYERSTGSTVRRKIQEWFLALELEKQMSKDQILLRYLNTINLAAGNYGVREAASFYFGKEVSELTLSECAVIAAITQNPSANNPARFPENNSKRAKKCLNDMLKEGHISQAEYDAAVKDNVYARIVASSQATAGGSIYTYYQDVLIQQVVEDLQDSLGYSYAQAYNAVFSGGLQIYSNQDPQAQAIIDREISDESNYENIETTYSISWNLSIKRADGTNEYFNQNHIIQYYRSIYGDDWYLDFASKEEADRAVEEYKKYLVQTGDQITYEGIIYTLQPQASFSLMDYRTGEVLGICGGRGEKETSMSLNRATQTTRQPGSTFKIVSAFAPALDTGACTLATVFDDEPFTYPGLDKEVKNWWGDSYRGLHTIRHGIRDSMNIVAVKTLLYIGASTCLPYLQSFGYKSIVEGDAALSTAIGGVTWGVTNLENCAAFGAIANDGVYREPMFYSRVLARDGSVLLDAEQVQDVHEVISVETATLLTDAMRDVVTSGTAVMCDIDSAPLAGKTGTTNDYRDLWFVGYVPNGLCSCIWLGYDENMSVSANNEAQKKFYSTIMEQLVVQQHAEGGEFELKGDIVEALVCNKSGRVSNGYCEDDPAGSTLYYEYFAAGTVPTRECFVHTQVKICKESGKLATEYCPEDSVEEVVRRIRDDLIEEPVHKGTTPDSEYEVPKEVCDIHDETFTTTSETTEESSSEEEKTTTAEEVTDAPAPETEPEETEPEAPPATEAEVPEPEPTADTGTD